jgi:hypothetical protein
MAQLTASVYLNNYRKTMITKTESLVVEVTKVSVVYGDYLKLRYTGPSVCFMSRITYDRTSKSTSKLKHIDAKHRKLTFT